MTVDLDPRTRSEPEVPNGQQVGPLRVDWGENWAELECPVCSAGWTGPIGEPCGWCALRIEQTQIEQRRLLLRPDLPDRGDKRRVEAVKAWGCRLRVAYQAGTIDRRELDAAWTRETT